MQEVLGLILGYLIQYIFLSNVKKIRRMVKNILSVTKMASTIYEREICGACRRVPILVESDLL